MSESESKPSARRQCPRCGAELPASVPPDLCPKCLLQAGLPTDAVAPGMKTMIVRPTDVLPRGLPQPGEQLGHYRIIGLARPGRHGRGL